MGKQAKKRRQAAAALAAQAHLASPTPQQLPPRDEPPVRRDEGADDDGDARRPIPSRINTRRETAVGPDWAPEFARYMSPILPRIVAEERRIWLRWWDNEYVRGRLMKRLGANTVLAALACLRDGGDANDVASEFERSPEWVRRQISLVVTLAATYFQQRPPMHEHRQADA